MPSDQAIKNRQDIQRIRQQMLAGKITYDEAADLAAPVIKRINDQAKAIAKRHGVHAKLISFAGLMR